MPHFDTKSLIVGLALGYFVAPMIVARMRGAAAKAA